MANNKKIAQLPNFTGSTNGVHLVMNDSENTTTYTVTKEIFLTETGFLTTSLFNDYKTSITPTVINRSSNAILINTPIPTVVTDMSATPNEGTYLVNFNSQFTVDSTSSQTLEAKSDLISLYDTLVALSATETGHAPTYGSETLGPGVYTQEGATNLTGTLTLDAGGDPDALFVFRCGGAFTTGVSSEIVLISGATSNNVWFISEGASNTGANTIFRGSLIANQAAIGTGTDTQIEGRMFTINGAATLADSSIFTEPTGSSVIDLGILSLFNIFCGTGNVSNTGASNIELSVGTNDGTITGFDTATVGGSLIPGGDTPLSIFRCGVYVDGVIIEDSLRSTSRPQSSETFEYPVILQTVATITTGQTIDIRGYSELGIQTIGPRMSFVLTPINT